MATQNPTKSFADGMETKTVIDTTCTKAVPGETWFENYMKTQDDTSLNQVGISESHKILKFIDGSRVIATWKAKLPVQIDNSKCFIKAGILKEKIPLL